MTDPSSLARVGSTAAIQSLATYSFSDEEDEVAVSPEKRRRTLSKEKIGDWSEHVRLHEKGASQDTASFSEPAAPVENKEISISDEESPLHEPPPPPRPHEENTPSPSPKPFSRMSSARNSPGKLGVLEESDVSARSQSSQLPPVARAGGLVSYAHDEDDEVPGSSGEEGKEEESRSKPVTEVEEEDSRPSSSKPSSHDGDGEEQLDVDDYLEETLNTEHESQLLERCRPSGVSVHIRLPPKPRGKCKEALQAKIDDYLRKKRERGLNPNDHIQAHKTFRNPSIYEKVVEMLKIDEIGSNFSRSRFDPHAFKPEDFYEELARAQKTAMDKMEKDRSSKPAPDADAKSKAKQQAAEDLKKRKSKWDVPSGTTAPAAAPAAQSVGPISVTTIPAGSIGSGAKAAVALHSSIGAPMPKR